jgi:hypothetical protein
MISDRGAHDGAMVDDPGLRIMANTREPGPAELHEKTNHVFIMKEGEGTFITGGPRSLNRIALVMSMSGGRPNSRANSVACLDA